MLNKLTIRKQSNLNDLIKIAYKLTEIGVDIYGINYDGVSKMEGQYNSEAIMLCLENDDEIVMYADLNIEETYGLYQKVID